MNRGVALLLTSLTLGACAEGSTQPEVEFEVIEETVFAASLGVDLSAMTRLESGVYVQDLVVGTGPPAVLGNVVDLNLTGWLANGTQWTQTTERLSLGNSPTISGLEDAVFLMPEGGVRRAVIPPARGYGAVDFYDGAGNLLVPAGSILVFEIELVLVAEPAGNHE